ncbi:hypothetical protein [Streptomyces sp. NPDC096324]|uniref:hypothetical protein n=1 Tax=Streptomyces sp. NPDC096324 TaxID=3366085 RepID=UPI003802F2EA
MTRRIADLDVTLPTLRERMAALVEKQRQAAADERRRQKRDESVARLRLILAEQPHVKATPGEAAELRHLLHDADPDATVPAFPYPTSLEAS